MNSHGQNEYKYLWHFNPIKDRLLDLWVFKQEYKYLVNWVYYYIKDVSVYLKSGKI